LTTGTILVGWPQGLPFTRLPIATKGIPGSLCTSSLPSTQDTEKDSPRRLLAKAMPQRVLLTLHKTRTLILGSRGLGPVKHAFVGSVSDYCIHHAHCPVFVVKHP
jgi:Universal stress protein family